MSSDSTRVYLRRGVFVAVIALQLFFVVRAYWAPHREFGFQMFPEASSWQADIVRVTADGRRVSVEQPWFGYEWSQLAPDRGLPTPWIQRHADDGVDNQVALLKEALAWVAANTPRDTETRYYEATVTTWRNMHDARTTVLRSPTRDVP